VANTITTPKRAFGKLFNAVAIAAALCASSASQAGVLDFEVGVESPFVFSGDLLTLGEYYVQGAGTAGFVGAIGGNDACVSVQCPSNNPSNYYSALDDGYFFFGKADGSKFKISSLDASFIGAGEPSYPAVSALLYIAGYDGADLVNETYLELSGPIGGSFNFANYVMGRFGDYEFTDVLVASFACNAAGDCNRNTNQANFAIDNITTYVPEPGSFALMGLGLLGLGAASRRRAAKAASVN
jgi:hypothetical protein